MHKIIQLITVFTLSALSATSNAAIRYVFDFDGTIVNDHEENAAWRTDWILVRVDKRHSALQQNPAAPIKIKINGSLGPDEFYVQYPARLYVSYAEYKMMQSQLAKGDADFGNLDPEKPIQISPHPTLTDQPIWILPGLYRVEPAVTFERFQMIGENYEISPLMEDAMAADRREQQSKSRPNPLKVAGPGFEMFRNVVENPNNRHLISFNTARGFTKEQLDELFTYWVRTGRLKRHPNKSDYTLHSAGDPSLFDRYDRGELHKLKVKAIELEAHQILKAPFKKHLEYTPRLTLGETPKQALMNTLLFSEDDTVHATNVGLLMATLSNRSEFKFSVKFVLRQVDSQKRSPRFPYEYTVFYDGLYREALPEEIALWNSGDCSSFLEGRAS